MAQDPRGHDPAAHSSAAGDGAAHSGAAHDGAAHNGAGGNPPARSGAARTVSDLLEERLRQLGVARVYGLPLGGLAHVDVADPDLAVLLADADGRIAHHDGSGRLGAALLAGPILHLSSKPGGVAPLQVIGSAEELLDALVDPPGMAIPGTSALHLDLDLNAPVPNDLAASSEPERQPVMTLDPSMASLDLVVVVGPGVVRTNSLDALRSFSRLAGVGVLNTFGAKGVERWDSPFHFGTAGLQERDFELAGVGAADIVIASGLDPDETPLERLGSWVVQEVPPAQLAALGHRWEPTREQPERPALYETLARVITPRYESDGVPLTAARAALHLSGALPERGVVVADAGLAGFWVGRALPTSFPGSVCVPSDAVPGFAAAAALVAAVEGRPVLAVSDQADSESGLDEVSGALFDLARSLELCPSIQLWGPDGTLDDSSAHVELLRDELAGEQIRVDRVPVQTDDLDAIESAAGPIVAWDSWR